MIFTPSSVNTSELPLLLVIDRFPCFATFTPAPATTNETAVEILNEPELSPPVPQTSIVLKVSPNLQLSPVSISLIKKLFSLYSIILSLKENPRANFSGICSC